MATNVGIEIARILLLAEIERQRQQKTAAVEPDANQDTTAAAQTPTRVRATGIVPARCDSRQPSVGGA